MMIQLTLKSYLGFTIQNFINMLEFRGTTIYSDYEKLQKVEEDQKLKWTFENR